MRTLILAFGLISSSALSAAPVESSTESREMQTFLNSLKQEIQKQQKLVTKTKEQIERTDIVPPAAILAQFENAYIMLNVKQTLYGNFANSSSIQSPLVRDMLLSIFKKDIISPGDLSQLEALVKQERPKYVNQETTPVGS